MQAASSPYPGVVIGDGAVGYYRFSDSLTRNLINVNSGSLGLAGNGSNDLASVFGGVVYSMPGAIVGDPDRAEFFDFTTRTEIPFNAALNTPYTQPFTIESWIYPVSDQVSTGMGVWCNRYTQGATRQGWVMYQRAPDANHCTSCGPGVGWEFRMYNNQDSSGHLDVTSGIPFSLGKWQHVVVVYDPVQVTNATATIYIDGIAANTNIWAATDNATPGYYPCQSTNAIQPNGPPALSLGGYNNANGGAAGFENPWIGGIDEFAWYSNKLSPAQILTHYQDGTNAARAIPYAALILSDHPVAYLRLNEVAPGPDTAFNIGDLRSSGHATNTPAVKHPGVSALAGDPKDSSMAGHLRGVDASGHAYADMPFAAGNNPDAGMSFTVELWARPTSDNVNNGPALLNNRLAGTASDRTGWVIYQRDPNASYAGTPAGGGEGIGWDFRPYYGSTHSSGGDVKSQLPYNIGEWQYLVFTWVPDPSGDLGPSASGSETWRGTLTAYVNGVPVATNSSSIYAANTNTPSGSDAGLTPADFAIGSYNLGSGLGEEFEGDLDEVAFYSNIVLTADQILAHYMAGTNAHPATSYETLVLTAGGDSYLAAFGPPIPERTTIPQTYLRFNEPAYFPATNSGSLGHLADGVLVLTTNLATGSAGAGFGSPNPAVPANGTTSWVALNNPVGFDNSPQISLEAWINPAANQGPLARIVSHGPATRATDDISTYPNVVFTGWQLNSNEVFLAIESGASTNYSVGTSDGTTWHRATAVVPAGDLGGANGWIYLAGTFDGTHWNLYRNGAQVASVADSQGPLPINGPEWAIGATGMGWGDFFSGSVDEVAIYHSALTPTTVAAHYYVGLNGPVNLTITRSGSNITVHWPAGTLQQAEGITGTWTNVATANPPSYTTAIGTKTFYRAKL
jgi:hypothetical protein